MFSLLKSFLQLSYLPFFRNNPVTMSQPLVLITGANGYIASRTVETFLKAGFRVRGTVRKLASAAQLQKVLAAYGSALEIVEVPDILIDGAFDVAVKGECPHRLPGTQILTPA